MKTRTTPRLFYKKFPFKARLKPDWAISARVMSRDEIIAAKKEKTSRFAFGRWHRLAVERNTDVLALHDFLAQYSKDDIKYRVEGQLSMFFKDIKVLEDLQAKFPKIVDEFWAPANKEVMEHMLSEVRVEVKETLTHDCRYKVYLRGRINNISDENRKSFISLYNRHQDQFVVPRGTKNDFERPCYSFYGSPYFYVRDSKFLLMAQMLIQPVIKETVKMITIEELNQKETENV